MEESSSMHITDNPHTYIHHTYIRNPNLILLNYQLFFSIDTARRFHFNHVSSSQGETSSS